MAGIVVIAPSPRGSAICHRPNGHAAHDRLNSELLQGQDESAQWPGRGRVSGVGRWWHCQACPEKALEAVLCARGGCSSGGWR